MNKVKIGVIPAAGEGKRIGYIGRILPKPLLPVYDKPIIQIVMENMKKFGVEEVYIPVYHQKEKFRTYFQENKNTLPVKVNLIELDKPTSGIANTIEKTEDYISESFAVILGDDCTISNSFDNIIQIFDQKDAIVVEGVVYELNPENLKAACCLKLNEDHSIADIIEKPKNPTSNIRGCGIYLFKEEIFNYIKNTPILPPRNEVEITNTIKLVSKEGRAYGALIDGINMNINNCDDLLHASIKEYESSHHGAFINVK